jgi:hypothetical protein
MENSAATRGFLTGASWGWTDELKAMDSGTAGLYRETGLDVSL